MWPSDASQEGFIEPPSPPLTVKVGTSEVWRRFDPVMLRDKLRECLHDMQEQNRGQLLPAGWIAAYELVDMLAPALAKKLSVRVQ